MTDFVVDASVAIKWVLPEAGSDQAIRLPTLKLAAPELLLVEISNVLATHYRKGTLSSQSVVRAWSVFRRFPVTLHGVEPLSAAALAAACDLQHPSYDCFYLVLARRLGTKLITADARLLRGIAGKLPYMDLATHLNDAVLPDAPARPS